MDTESALKFLRSHQPLPPDEELDQELIVEYDDVRKYFLSNPDDRCIPLFLNSFGKGGGMGVYQLVEDTLLVHNHDVVIACLVTSLSRDNGGVACWSADIASSFPDARLVTPLADLLRRGDVDERYAAITALERIGGARVDILLSDHLARESDVEVRELLSDVLGGLEGAR